jgi:hypothetical protein
MKVKMREAFQGTGQSGFLIEEGITVTIFEKGDTLEVDNTLGGWLVDNGKADEIRPIVYATTPQPEPRHDDVIFEEARPHKRGHKAGRND